MTIAGWIVAAVLAIVLLLVVGAPWPAVLAGALVALLLGVIALLLVALGSFGMWR